jgi:hypothetical protein
VESARGFPVAIRAEAEEGQLMGFDAESPGDGRALRDAYRAEIEVVDNPAAVALEVMMMFTGFAAFIAGFPARQDDLPDELLLEEEVEGPVYGRDARFRPTRGFAGPSVDLGDG